jgi:hypothetical protein
MTSARKPCSTVRLLQPASMKVALMCNLLFLVTFVVDPHRILRLLNHYCSARGFRLSAACTEFMTPVELALQVLVELQKTLGQVEESQAEAYRNTRELYASCRMLLAMLPPEVLPVVCGELECRMWEVLAPCRGVRPSLGGRGWSDELVLDLKSLYVDVT